LANWGTLKEEDKRWIPPNIFSSDLILIEENECNLNGNGKV